MNEGVTWAQLVVGLAVVIVGFTAAYFGMLFRLRRVARAVVDELTSTRDLLKQTSICMATMALALEIAIGPEASLGESISDEEVKHYAASQPRKLGAPKRHRKEYRRLVSRGNQWWPVKLQHDALLFLTQMEKLEAPLVARSKPQQWRALDDDEKTHFEAASATGERIGRDWRWLDPQDGSAGGSGSGFARNASVSRRSDEPIQPSNNRQRKENDNAN